MTRVIRPIALACLLLHHSAAAAEIMTVDCSNGETISLNISSNQAQTAESPSANNFASTLTIGTRAYRGSTGIFYGGQSRYFTSDDGLISFNMTLGHGESHALSTAELETPQGRSTCIPR